MRHIKGKIAMVILVTTGAVGAYHFMLDDHAKDKLKSLKDTLQDSYKQIKDLVDDFLDEFIVKDEVEDNQQRVRDEWKQIGY